MDSEKLKERTKEFLLDEGLMKRDQAESLLNEARELTAIFFASRKTAKIT